MEHSEEERKVIYIDQKYIPETCVCEFIKTSFCPWYKLAKWDVEYMARHPRCPLKSIEEVRKSPFEMIGFDKGSEGGDWMTEEHEGEVRWVKCQVPLPLSDSSKVVYRCPFCGALVYSEDEESCPKCKAKIHGVEEW